MTNITTSTAKFVGNNTTNQGVLLPTGETVGNNPVIVHVNNETHEIKNAAINAHSPKAQKPPINPGVEDNTNRHVDQEGDVQVNNLAHIAKGKDTPPLQALETANFENIPDLENGDLATPDLWVYDEHEDILSPSDLHVPPLNLDMDRWGMVGINSRTRAEKWTKIAKLQGRTDPIKVMLEWQNAGVDLIKEAEKWQKVALDMGRANDPINVRAEWRALNILDPKIARQWTKLANYLNWLEDATSIMAVFAEKGIKDVVQAWKWVSIAERSKTWQSRKAQEDTALQSGHAILDAGWRLKVLSQSINVWHSNKIGDPDEVKAWMKFATLFNPPLPAATLARCWRQGGIETAEEAEFWIRNITKNHMLALAYATYLHTDPDRYWSIYTNRKFLNEAQEELRSVFIRTYIAGPSMSQPPALSCLEKDIVSIIEKYKDQVAMEELEQRTPQDTALMVFEFLRGTQQSKTLAQDLAFLTSYFRG